jgi:outer membrane lipoprotein LolB
MLVFAGCATLPAEPPADAPRLAGRLSVRVDAEPVRAVTADFELRGDARRGLLLLSSPLGAAMAEARWSPNFTVLLSPEGRYQFPDLDEMAAQTLGERLPMAALFDWLRGRPWAGANHATLPPPGAGFEQLGWQVRLDRWADGFVEARRAAPPVVTVRARLEPATP